MLILAVGALLIVVGALMISFPELCKVLKEQDETRWQQLGAPYGHMFTHKTTSVFTWVLARGYLESSSDEVKTLGGKARGRALFAKYLLLAGVALVLSGFVVSLVNA